MSSFVVRSTPVAPGLKFHDKLIKNYKLADKVVQIGKHMEGKKEVADFVVKKVPVVTKSFHMSKEIQQNSKGADLKSIIKRVETTGDISLLHSREVIYGDSSQLPKNTGEAYQKVLTDSEKLNSLSKDEVDLVALCKGKTPEEVIKICTEYYENKLVSGKPEVKESEVKKEGSENE